MASEGLCQLRCKRHATPNLKPVRASQVSSPADNHTTVVAGLEPGAHPVAPTTPAGVPCASSGFAGPGDNVRPVADQLDVLKLIAARLDLLGIQYMLTGSVAAGWYAQPRMTRDIDLVAELYPLHAQKLADGLKDEFECDVDVLTAAIGARRPFSIFHRASIQKIDIVVRQDSDYELEKFGRRREVELEGQRVRVISPEDLILSKLSWAKQSPSELQLRDVRAVIAVQADLDWAYIDRWALKLTVASLLAEVRQ